MESKPIVWVGQSRDALVKFPEDARREAGHDLWLVQQGRSPRDWRPMPDVGAGVVEIRIHARTEHRVFYVAKFEEAVYVLHAFDKTTRATSKRDLNSGRSGYAQVLARRARSS